MDRGDVAVSEMKIVFDVGKIDETWKEYNITEAYLKYNDKHTPYKAILKNNRLVAIVGRGYQVLPNEVVKQVADEIASRLNAEPLLEKTRLPTEWGNAYFSKDSWKVYLVYTIPEWHEIDGRDRCKIGFAFRNSIDGTLAFSVTGFTYREIDLNIFTLPKLVDTDFTSKMGLFSAKVRLPNQLVFSDFLEAALCDFFSEIQNSNPVSYRRNYSHIMFNYDNSKLFLFCP